MGLAQVAADNRSALGLSPKADELSLCTIGVCVVCKSVVCALVPLRWDYWQAFSGLSLTSSASVYVFCVCFAVRGSWALGVFPPHSLGAMCSAVTAGCARQRSCSATSSYDEPQSRDTLRLRVSDTASLICPGCCIGCVCLF